jgi:hypothetical protein
VRTPLVLLPLAVLLLTGCGADRTSPAAAPSSPARDAGEPSTAPHGDHLEVTYDAGDGSAPQTWELTCSPPGGTHPDPAGACADLAAATAPFAEPDPDLVCTEQYGGPQTARVTGTWASEPVETSFDRVDGCAISRWDSVGRLLPAADTTALEPDDLEPPA